MPAFLDELEKISASHKAMCHRCGKAHVPVCDRCGKKLGEGPDFRSLHGPCDRCAFKKEAFAEKVKEAFMRDVGTFAKNLGGKVLNSGPVQGTGRFLGRQATQAGEAAAGFLTPGHSWKKGWSDTWRPVDPATGQRTPISWPWKALMAYDLYSGVRDTAAKNDPTGAGRSRLRRGLHLAGSQLGGIMGAPYGIVGGLVAGGIGGKVGDTAGRVVDYARRRAAQPAQLPPPQGQQG